MGASTNGSNYVPHGCTKFHMTAYLHIALDNRKTHHRSRNKGDAPGLPIHRLSLDCMPSCTVYYDYQVTIQK